MNNEGLSELGRSPPCDLDPGTNLSGTDLHSPEGHQAGWPDVIPCRDDGSERAAEPQTVMQLAFSEANLNAKDFSDREHSLENTERLDEQGLPSDHEPLLRTLYLLQHGQVLGKGTTHPMLMLAPIMFKASFELL
ncbi:hypothetical protein [Methylobacter tundripaludum]|uniref:Uncharacterized protein n=1 Tax=Methylobacter tundripaludum (strain ATCC BAA-1195 / DSM 17260 / SV96) TaxID=697282 RepID=G3IV62_METTV|nr:hypothetical protein [Methylobacter tundripaludum]EGW21675.1 hypothetical protein Mettu_0448 [Methylobacter tundripaludum SV96]